MATVLYEARFRDGEKSRGGANAPLESLVAVPEGNSTTTQPEKVVFGGAWKRAKENLSQKEREIATLRRELGDREEATRRTEISLNEVGGEVSTDRAAVFTSFEMQ